MDKTFSMFSAIGITAVIYLLWCTVSYHVYGYAQYHLFKEEWHCTSYDYNADMCIQYSKKPPTV